MGLFDKLIGNLVSNAKGAGRQLNPFDGGATFGRLARKPYIEKGIDTHADPEYAGLQPIPRLAANMQHAQLATSQFLPSTPSAPQISFDQPHQLYPTNLVNFAPPQTRFQEDDISPSRYLQPTSFNSGQATLNGSLMQGQRSNPKYGLRIK